MFKCIVNQSRSSLWRGIFLTHVHVQEANETKDQYVTEIARNCITMRIYIGEQLIQDQIVCRTNTEVIKQPLLHAEHITIDKVMALCIELRNS